jgi:hypothetical protein
MTIVEAGFFRTELLDSRNVKVAVRPILTVFLGSRSRDRPVSVPPCL